MEQIKEDIQTIKNGRTIDPALLQAKRRLAMLLIGSGMFMGLVVLGCDVALTFSGFPGGLSEGITTPLISMSTGLTGAGGAIELTS